MVEIVQPDILGSFIGGMNTARQKKQQDLQDYNQRLLSSMVPRAINGDTSAIAPIAGANPDLAIKLKGVQQSDQLEKYKQAYAESSQALAAPSKVHAIMALPHLVQALQNQGIDPSTMDENSATTFLTRAKMIAASSLGLPAEQPKFQQLTPGAPFGTVGPDGTFSQQGIAPKQQIGTVPPPEFTPASLEKFNQSGNYADLVPVAKPTAAGGGTYGVAGLTPEENAALFGTNGAVPMGKLNPDKINSRTAKFLAQAFLLNPDQDMNRLASEGSMMRNAAFMNRAITVESLPDIMQNMVNAGKKVGFSDVKIVGRLQKWSKGELNDPALTEYMTIRNDALMNIASAMRGAGMSDKAHEAEIEAASPSMSPAALDAWLKGQMETLRPRLKRMERYTRPGGKLPDQPTPSGGGAAPVSGTEDPLGIR